jgi:hypothetical protein
MKNKNNALASGGKKKIVGSCSGYPTVNNRYSTTTIWREELLPISTGNELFPVKS